MGKKSVISRNIQSIYLGEQKSPACEAEIKVETRIQNTSDYNNTAGEQMESSRKDYVSELT